MITSLLQFKLCVYYVLGTMPEKGSCLGLSPQGQHLGAGFTDLLLPEGRGCDEGSLPLRMQAHQT